MGFYENISTYYDSIFPFKKATFAFLLESLDTVMPEGGSVVDVACGSGSYAIGFSGYCQSVYGYDLDPFMIAKANEKNRYDNVTFKPLNMLDINKQGLVDVDMVYCIGNSIVHLGDEDQILRFFREAYEVLEQDGVFVVQIINYDRIITGNVTSLPTIVNDEDGVTFTRDYVLHKDKVEFVTKLDIETDHMTESFQQKVALLPLRSKEMKVLLEMAGFKSVEMFGDFKKAPFDPMESYGLVVRAMKEEME